MEKKRITLAYGDGIGPEIMRATLRVLEASGAPLDYDVVEIGESVYRKGTLSGIAPDAWDVIRANRVLLKAPVTTPQGGGFKSVNVTLRTVLGLFANVRPCKAYTPFVASLHPTMDLVIVRENQEDLYGGIEHRQTQEVTQVLKLISRPGTEAIVRYAFEYARAYGRRKVTCMTKDNIMKITDGLFHRIFDEIAVEYPDLHAEHLIIDIGTARVAAAPETLDVIVTPNLYGDILSDVAAQLAGSVGLAGSTNIGREAAMFEAIHGSAPDIAGKGIANPSGLLQAAVQMLVHLGLSKEAEAINNAWLCTLEDGIHTSDIFREGLSRMRASTDDFADAIIERLGHTPERLLPAHFRSTGISANRIAPVPAIKTLVGVDMFLEWDEAGRDATVLGRRVEALNDERLKLKMISNRGVKVYPGGMPETFRTDHWRCRFTATAGGLTYTGVLDLLSRAHTAGLHIIKTENLYEFDGKPGYAMGQGE
ncbi:MAG: NADP-dependent isocitrate dehydrogenase [Anaerolineae bacterium]|nr:NADP-dependent isocitrate dehydrogenase [Anaerolineae bacterium]